MRILLVEDEEDQVMLVRAAVEATGLKAVTIEHVQDGRACLDFLQDCAPGATATDLVLLDLNMPAVSGFDVLEERTRQPALKIIPMVVMTTSRNVIDVRKCYELGCNTYVLKPVDFEVLVSSLKQIIEYWMRVAILPPAPARVARM